MDYKYIKPSLTLILSCLIMFIVSCSSIPTKNEKKQNIKLNLDIKTSNKNKEIIIESLLKDDIKFSINFDSNNAYLLKNDVLNSKMKYFCKSFLSEQRDAIESSIFKKKEGINKKILIIYSNKYESIAMSIKSKHPNELYFLLNKEGFEENIQKVLDINSSFQRYSKISNLDKNIEINHIPRSRKDISKIYFLVDYDFGKTIVPVFRSYALDIKFYSTSELFHNATDVKKLADFENTFIPLPLEIIQKINNKRDIVNMKNGFEILMINDFLTIEKDYQNNNYSKNIILETGPTKFQRNKCINRNLPISKININNITLQT